MRHTLLPLYERKKLRMEYYVRLSIVLCSMASLAIVSGSILLLPAYISARGEEQDQVQAIAELKQDKNRGTDSVMISELKSDAVALGILGESLLQERSSVAVEKLVGLRKDVYLSSILYTVSSANAVEVTVQGVAPTRASLLAFRDRLEKYAPSSKVDLPLSGLAKSSDIPFSLKVVYTKP